jgi:hypothetical protein
LTILSKVKSILPYFAIAITSFATAFWVLGVRFGQISRPWSESGEILNYYIKVQSLSESGSAQQIARLGWPFLSDGAKDFNSNWLVEGIWRALLLFNDPISTVNIFLVASFSIIALVTYFTWRVLGFSHKISAIAAFALSFLPWHLQKIFSDPNLVFYIAAPLLILAIVSFVKWQIENQAKFLITAFASIFVISITFKDFWIFSLIFLIAYYIYSFTTIAKIDLKRILGYSALILIIPISIFISFLYQKSLQNYPTVSSSANQDIVPLEVSSGSFASLIAPNPLSGIPFFSSIRRAFDNLVSFNGSSTLSWNSAIGVVIIVSALWIIFSLSFGSKKSLVNKTFIENNLNAYLAKLFLLLFLIGLGFYWTTGLGTIFGFTLIPSIVAWERIYIFVIYFAFASVMLFVKQAGPHLFRKKEIKTGALLLTLVVIFLDQILNPYPTNVSAAEAKYQEAKEFSSILSTKIPENCAILQIPVLTYPAQESPINDYRAYDHLWLALADQEFNFSYGAHRQTQQFSWQKNLNEPDPMKLLLQAAAVGYCAVVVDLAAFESRVETGNQWIKAVGAPVAVSSAARYAAWKAPDQYTRNQLRELTALSWSGSFAAGEVEDSIQIDFYDTEFSLFALNPTQEDIVGEISLQARSGNCSPAQNLKVVDASTSQLLVDQNLIKELSEVKFEFTLTPREQKEFEFELSSKYCTVEWWSDAKASFREQTFSVK